MSLRTRIAAGLVVGFSATSGAQAIGSVAEDRARTAEILGDSIHRVTGTRADAPRFLAGVIPPDVLFVWNSSLPYSLNDGSLWAGRGANLSITGGFALAYATRTASLTFLVAPTLTTSANKPFDIIPGRDSSRSTYSSPWHTAAGSADLPLRFGTRQLHRIGWGESSVTLRVRGVEGGLSSASQWWGPGIRNALVMSNNAGGIPRAFLRTAAPLHTRIGAFTVEGEVGTLTESAFFDTLTSNDHRTIGAVLVTYRPLLDSGLTFGLTRSVYKANSRGAPRISSLTDLLRWRPPSGAGASLPADQLASLFGRWVPPRSGFEVFAEWARMELPRSLADFLEAPHSTQGYTIGFQWATPRPTRERVFRIQTELSYLEQNLVFRDRPPVDFYTGRAAEQGYTERGQIIGAAIGPGGSGQWIAFDYLVPRWQAGVFFGRTRWEDNAMYREQFASNFSHDVSIYSGVRAALRMPIADLSADVTVARRMNYLFQNGFSNPGGLGTVSIQNLTFTTRITPP